jgi:signal peptidase I
MALSQQETRDLQQEASDLYEKYGLLKSDFRKDRSNSDIEEQLEMVQRRYRAIEFELKKHGEKPVNEHYQIPDFDVGHYKAHKPKPSQHEPHGSLELVFAKLKPRTLISLTLLILFGTTLFFISNQSIGFFLVPSSSMEPRLTPDDKLITFRKSQYQRGDLIVFRDPLDEKSFMVKRIVALPSDEIQIRNGTLKVNALAIREPYINETILYRFGPYRVPEEQIFVLGDNRNESQAGHKWGKGIPEDTIIGKVKYIYAPWDRMQSIPAATHYFAQADLE